jgi:hypothetical protein
MIRTKNRFDMRAFVTLMIAFCALGLPITGIAGHVCGFTPWTESRQTWMVAHSALGLLFIVFAIRHAIINRRTLSNYIRGVATRLPSLSREAALAGAAVALILLLFTGHAIHAGG